MAKDADTRIRERNQKSELHLEGRGPLSRAVGTAGLAAADTVDAVSGIVTNRRPTFIRATSLGLFRGALYGGIVAMFTIACFTGLAVSGPLVFGIAAGIGALFFGAHDGQGALENKLNRPNRGIADVIAEKTGAVPEKTPEKTSEKEKAHPSQPGDRRPFLQRERERRAARAAQAQGQNQHVP